MKTLYIEQPKRQKYLFLLMAGTFMLQGIIHLARNEAGFSFWFGLFMMFFSLTLIMNVLYFMKPKSNFIPRILLGNASITLHRGTFSKPKTISIEEIKLIQLKPERLTIMTKEYDFSHSIAYEGANKDLIRKEIEAYSTQMNLPLEKVGYRNV